jgi:hypothetical protein
MASWRHGVMATLGGKSGMTISGYLPVRVVDRNGIRHSTTCLAMPLAQVSDQFFNGI